MREITSAFTYLFNLADLRLCFSKYKTSRTPPATAEFFAVKYLLTAAMFPTVRRPGEERGWAWAAQRRPEENKRGKASTGYRSDVPVRKSPHSAAMFATPADGYFSQRRPSSIFLNEGGLISLQSLTDVKIKQHIPKQILSFHELYY